MLTTEEHYLHLAEKLIDRLTQAELNALLRQEPFDPKKFSAHYSNILKYKQDPIFSVRLNPVLKNKQLTLDWMHPDIAVSQIVPLLSLQDLLSLNSVSKNTQGLFKPSLEKRQAAILLDSVGKANYLLARKIVASNPRLIFQSIRVSDESHDDTLSPLQLALRIRSYNMLDIFLEKISKDKGYTTQFIGQYRLEVRINLQPLFDKYDDIIEMYKSWKNNALDAGRMNNALLDLGKMQFKLLPAHMLKVFCCEFGWFKDSSLLYKEFSNAYALNYAGVGIKSIGASIDILDPKLEVSFFLVSAECRSGWKGGWRSACITNNFKRFESNCSEGAIRPLQRDLDTLKGYWQQVDEALANTIQKLEFPTVSDPSLCLIS